MKKSFLFFVFSLAACPTTWAETTQMTGVSESSTLDFENAGNWKISVGGGVASVPRYEGAATNRLRFAPLLEAENGHFFAGTTRGLGYNFSDNKELQYGLRVTLSHGRKQNADVRLNGMGDLNTAGEAGVFVNAHFSPLYLTGSLATGSHGARLDLGGGFETRLSETDHVRIGGNLNWGNTKYNQTYFGVNAAQATASGGILTAYNANAGVKDYGITANWTHAYSREWFSNAGLSFKQLSGSAKSSPLTAKSSINSANFVVGYHF